MKQRFTKTALALAFLPILAMAEGPSAGKPAAQAYNNVTDARLQNPEARNWLSTNVRRRTFSAAASMRFPAMKPARPSHLLRW
jgi:hypothetical protein